MTSNTSRLPVIDAIRGFALWGILIFNIQTYALFSFLKPQQVYQLRLGEEAMYAPLQFFFHVFVNGQFYTIYSFIFGLSFYLLWQKNNASDLDADKAFKRRLWSLLLIGLLHGLLFWFGDILHKYALFGFILPWFNRKSNKVIFKWIVGLLLSSVLFQLAIGLLMPATNTSDPDTERIIMEVVNTWQNGTFAQVLNLQKLGMAMLWIRDLMNGFAGSIHYIAMFLLGLMAGKSDFFYQIPKYRAAMIRYCISIFPLALLLKSGSNLDVLNTQLLSSPSSMLMAPIGNFIAVPLIAIGYLICLILIFSRSAIFATWIGNAGKLGLTNYLMQTIICMLLFYGYAGSLSGKLTLLQTFICTIPVFIFQVIFSNIWLRYYKTGPVEKLWRRLSSS